MKKAGFMVGAALAAFMGAAQADGGNDITVGEYVNRYGAISSMTQQQRAEDMAILKTAGRQAITKAPKDARQCIMESVHSKSIVGLMKDAIASSNKEQMVNDAVVEKFVTPSPEFRQKMCPQKMASMELAQK